MQSVDLAEKIQTDYVAHGLSDLAQVLSTLHLAPGQAEKFILYQIGEQQSLLKVDRSIDPYKFTFCDRIGRPASSGFINTVANFLWNQASVQAQYPAMTQAEWQATEFKKYFQDLSRNIALANRPDMLAGEKIIYTAPIGSLADAKSLLMRASNSAINDAKSAGLAAEPTLSAEAKKQWQRGGMFAPRAGSELITDQLKNKPNKWQK